MLYRVRKGVRTTRVVLGDVEGGGAGQQAAEIECGADDTMSSHLQRCRG